MKIISSSFLIFVLVTSSAALQTRTNQRVQSPCKPKITMLPDGKLQVTDCQGKSSVTDLNIASRAENAVNQNSASSPAMSPKLAAAYEEFELSNLQYQQQQLARNMKVFGWQDVSSKIMFVLVAIIVTTGLVLSALQFRKAENIDLTVEMKGLHLTTSIVGVAILAMSMLFLYMYLFFVYPIKEVGR